MDDDAKKARMDLWRANAKAFLKDKSAEELTEILRTGEDLDRDTIATNLIREAMWSVTDEDDELAMALAELLVVDTNPKLRSCTDSVLRKWLFSFDNLRATEIIWDILAYDPDDDVFETSISWVDDLLEGAGEELTIPPEAYVHFSKLMAKAKKAREKSQ